jgi:hypothetical protein
MSLILHVRVSFRQLVFTSGLVECNLVYICCMKEYRDVLWLSGKVRLTFTWFLSPILGGDYESWSWRLNVVNGCNFQGRVGDVLLSFQIGSEKCYNLETSLILTLKLNVGLMYERLYFWFVWGIPLSLWLVWKSRDLIPRFIVKCKCEALELVFPLSKFGVG